VSGQDRKFPPAPGTNQIAGFREFRPLTSQEKNKTEILLAPRRWLVGGFLGLALCKSLSFLQDVSTAVSIFSLLAIAVDRYRGIVFPLRKNIVKTKLIKCIIPSIWIVSMVLDSFYFYKFKITLDDDKKMYCSPSWAPKFNERSSTETQYVVLLVVLIVVPVCVVTVLYSVMIEGWHDAKIYQGLSQRVG